MSDDATEKSPEKPEILIRVSLIENGVILVKAGTGWITFDSWRRASHYIQARIDKLIRMREQARNKTETDAIMGNLL